MTKAEFLKWLSQWRYVGHIRETVERHIFSEEDLDRIKRGLEQGGNLRMKKESERRLSWG